MTETTATVETVAAAQFRVRPGVYHLGNGRMVRVDVYEGGTLHGRRIVWEAAGTKSDRLAEVTGARRDAVIRALAG